MFIQEPILLASNREGVYVATSISEGRMQCLAPTKALAKKYLERKLMKSIRGLEVPHRKIYKSVTIELRSFPVQPMHIQRFRRYPVGGQLTIPVRVVRIVDNWDKLYGLLPDFGVNFYCPSEADFPNILQDAVRSVLSSISPEDLVHHWIPANCEVDWVRVRYKLPKSGPKSPRTPALQGVAEMWTAKDSPIVDDKSRSSEFNATVELLRNGCGLVIGESGVGKSTLIRAAAKEVTRQLRSNARNTETTLHRKYFWFTNANRLIAGMRYLGQWQERLENVIRDLGNLGATLIVDNLRDLVTAGGQTPSDSLAAFLIPYIRSGQLRLISEATPSQLDFCQRHLPSLIDIIPITRVAPMRPVNEVQLLDYLIHDQAKRLGFEVDDTVPAMLQRLCSQFLSGRPAPSGSIPFLMRWFQRVKETSRPRLPVENQSSLAVSPTPSHAVTSVGTKAGQPMRLSNESMLAEFSRWSGLPKVLIQDELPLTRTEVLRELSRDVIGQDRACHAATDVVLRLKARMSVPTRPLGCLLFCGPTGVGKTQLAKSLSKYLFGADASKSKMIRLDMSEFQSYAAGYRMLTNSRGESANWIQTLRNQPLQVLLLDEVEKAASEVLDILLSVLDEGRLTDNLGNTTSLRSTVIILTSNLGSTQNSLSGFHGSSTVDYESYVRKSLRPEFVNRLDAIVPFESLSQQSVQAMARKELVDLKNREGIERYGFQVLPSDSLVTHIAQVGFSASLGARPLQRAIENHVMVPLSHWLLAHRMESNDQWQRGARQLSLDWKQELVIELVSC